MMASGITIAFLGALQAALSVLLTICFGVVSAQFGLVSTDAAEQISHLCVQLLLPCLLIVNLGSELHLDTVVNYVPIIIWATIFTVTSLAIGRIATVIFRLPKWAVPAIAFNNTESLPLLLLQSLGTTGVLASLTGPGGEDEGIKRARTYFLACSVVNNTITFGLGPEILNGSIEDSKLVKAYRWVTGKPRPSSDPEDQQDGSDDSAESNSQSNDSDEEGDVDGADERTSLLPDRVVHLQQRAKTRAGKFQDCLATSPEPVQKIIHGASTFLNPPFIGAFIGVVIGLVPALHRLFFNDMSEGGYLNAWLTSSLKNVGELFVSLQVIVVGVKLSLSLRLWKKGEDAGTLPVGTVLCVIFIRFILWPLISIPLIWVLAARTNVLPRDPILWWTLMMMPIGPTAMKVLALADVSGASDKVRMSIAMFLTLSYIITPLVSFSVVGALEAAKAVL
ncbi:auxin efflux carrier [Xylariaceae sp. FL0016]|nr:auxin efflux carrier [Xylariaceae sp. FL0016]